MRSVTPVQAVEAVETGMRSSCGDAVVEMLWKDGLQELRPPPPPPPPHPRSASPAQPPLWPCPTHGKVRECVWCDEWEAGDFATQRAHLTHHGVALLAVMCSVGLILRDGFGFTNHQCQVGPPTATRLSSLLWQTRGEWSVPPPLPPMAFPNGQTFLRAISSHAFLSTIIPLLASTMRDWHFKLGQLLSPRGHSSLKRRKVGGVEDEIDLMPRLPSSRLLHCITKCECVCLASFASSSSSSSSTQCTAVRFNRHSTQRMRVKETGDGEAGSSRALEKKRKKWQWASLTQASVTSGVGVVESRGE
ncbi:unnamed protein product [Hydatigera taeniaeformis]|uniref:Uncharacterized protein n=1 Tax=Hydatigena taeniaeformis TaxID=6205 RepID=A0A0R3XA21_HYDTA|nr:unnamed protein product [Hydatigera taeniaeformis]